MLTFDRESDVFLAAGGSRWRLLSGVAVGGSHEGTRLRQVNDVSPEFFFAWLSLHPDTDVWGSD